jgi:uncharacterized flavoprotein (TIGR03862 family)
VMADVQVEPSVAVIGGGPAGLIAAETMAAAGHKVVVYDAMANFGRKFLLAGRGGLNLTHSEPFDQLLARYGNPPTQLEAALRAFPPAALREWCAGLGEDTFVGSSGRVFPTSFRATPLLRAWLGRLRELGVEFRPKHRWTGWNADGSTRFATSIGNISVRPSATVLALGGASWPRLGSTGSWVELVRAAGVAVAPLRPANSGFTVAWSAVFRDRFGGVPLKSLRLSCGGASARGEAMITNDGIEGGPVYALGPQIRAALERDGVCILRADLHPDLDADRLAGRLRRGRPGASQSTLLKRAGLSPVATALLRECDGEPTADSIKSVSIRITGVAPIERAISTAGGITFAELDAHFGLRRTPGVFVAGEMLDWEAPTGGYLLQACFSTGVAAAVGALDWLERAS